MEGRGRFPKAEAMRMAAKEPTKASSRMPIRGAEHAGGQQPGLGMAVGVVTDPGLQQRGGELERQGDQAHLGEAQAVVGLEHGVDRWQHRLDQVIDQVRQGAGADHAHHQGAGGWRPRRSPKGGTAGHRMSSAQARGAPGRPANGNDRTWEQPMARPPSQVPSERWRYPRHPVNCLSRSI